MKITSSFFTSLNPFLDGGLLNYLFVKNDSTSTLNGTRFTFSTKKIGFNLLREFALEDHLNTDVLRVYEEEELNVSSFDPHSIPVRNTPSLVKGLIAGTVILVLTCIAIIDHSCRNCCKKQRTVKVSADVVLHPKL